MDTQWLHVDATWGWYCQSKTQHSPWPWLSNCQSCPAIGSHMKIGTQESTIVITGDLKRSFETTTSYLSTEPCSSLKAADILPSWWLSRVRVYNNELAQLKTCDMVLKKTWRIHNLQYHVTLLMALPQFLISTPIRVDGSCSHGGRISVNVVWVTSCTWDKFTFTFTCTPWVWLDKVLCLRQSHTHAHENTYARWHTATRAHSGTCVRCDTHTHLFHRQPR